MEAPVDRSLARLSAALPWAPEERIWLSSEPYWRSLAPGAPAASADDPSTAASPAGATWQPQFSGREPGAAEARLDVPNGKGVGALPPRHVAPGWFRRATSRVGGLAPQRVAQGDAARRLWKPSAASGTDRLQRPGTTRLSCDGQPRWRSKGTEAASRTVSGGWGAPEPERIARRSSVARGGGQLREHASHMPTVRPTRSAGGPFQHAGSQSTASDLATGKPQERPRRTMAMAWSTNLAGPTRGRWSGERVQGLNPRPSPASRGSDGRIAHDSLESAWRPFGPERIGTPLASATTRVPGLQSAFDPAAVRPGANGFPVAGRASATAPRRAMAENAMAPAPGLPDASAELRGPVGAKAESEAQPLPLRGAALAGAPNGAGVAGSMALPRGRGERVVKALGIDPSPRRLRSSLASRAEVAVGGGLLRSSMTTQGRRGRWMAPPTDRFPYRQGRDAEAKDVGQADGAAISALHHPARPTNGSIVRRDGEEVSRVGVVAGQPPTGLPTTSSRVSSAHMDRGQRAFGSPAQTLAMSRADKGHGNAEASVPSEADPSPTMAPERRWHRSEPAIGSRIAQVMPAPVLVRTAVTEASPVPRAEPAEGTSAPEAKVDASLVEAIVERVLERREGSVRDPRGW